MINPEMATKGIFLAVFLLFLTTGVSASGGIQTYLGDTVPLSGYSYGSPWVYLFLTGPNLPVNGVALHNINLYADQGSFTRVDVDGMDHWSYQWNTANTGGRLDEGTYTVWVVNGPNDRSRLATADYSTISVTLTKPFIATGIPLTTGELTNGELSLQSQPDGASLVIDGEYKGKTPLTLDNVNPGMYTVNFSRFGYTGFSIPARVEAGKTTEVTATLFPLSGSLAVNTSPPGARVLLDGTEAGISPITLANITAGNHNITLEKEGYVQGIQQVLISPGRVSPVTITLVASPREIVPTIRAEGLTPATLFAGIFIILILAVRRRQSR